MNNQKIILSGLVLFALLLLGLFIRLPQTSTGLPAARTPDSIKTVDVAFALAQKWKEGRFVLDPLRYQYPTLYINSLAFLYCVTGATRDLERTARRTAMMAELLTIVAVFFVVLKITNLQAAFIAAIMSTFGFFFVSQGRYPSPDALQMLLFAGALYPLCRQKKTLCSRRTLGRSPHGTGHGNKIHRCDLFISLGSGPTLYSLGPQKK